MQVLELKEMLLSIPLGLHLGFVFALGMVFLIYSTMAKNRGFKQKIQTSKKLKAEVVDFLSYNLESVYFLTEKIIKDNEVVGMYNTETVTLGLRALSKLENTTTSTKYLEDEYIRNKFEFYMSDLKKVLETIYTTENDIYDYKKSSEQTIISYDRAFHKLSAEESTWDDAAKLKKSFKHKLEAYKKNINEMERQYHQHRENFHHQLISLNQQNIYLQSLLDMYRRKNIDAKRLYIRKLVYA